MDHLPNVRFFHVTPLPRELQGVEMQYKRNKITSLKLAAARLSGILICLGETFSFGVLLENQLAAGAISMGWCCLGTLAMTLATASAK